MNFALSTAFLVGLILVAMVFLADFTTWVNDEELAYELASRDMRFLLADCGEDLVCDRAPTTACRHTNNVVEIHTDLGPRTRWPLGVDNADASLYFNAPDLGVDVSQVRQCAP